MSAPDETPLLDHAYDEIREYDNPLPGWWRMIFYGSMAFAAAYVVVYHVAGGSTPDAEYRAELERYDAKRELRARAEAANVTEGSLAAAVRDARVVDRGAAVFAERCATCHGPNGGGLIGPNLTDDRQLHGDTRLDLFRTVRGGAPGTAMVAWGEQLAPADVVAAAAFAISLRGNRVPGGKAPEGAPVGAFAGP
jgi:cytochrome c oxidase cbb3-type subunit III